MSSGKVIGDNYKIVRLIGKGAFGSVYLTHDKNKNYYASKVESRQESSRLIDEYKIYRYLHKHDVKDGIAKIYSLIQTPKFNMMVMELLGESLDTLFTKSNKKFDLPTVLHLGINIINLLEQVHNAGFIHRDIKPNNFLIGYGDAGDKLYLTDFGLSKNYVRDGRHIDYNTKRNLIGTLRYASINMHMGIEPSRRDDCESVGYMLIYFLKGRLPWQGLKKKKGDDQVELIGDVKMSTSIESLCNGIHDNFGKYIRTCRNLKFEERPDYGTLRGYFQEIADELDIDPRYQWARHDAHEARNARDTRSKDTDTTNDT